jgi:hypothetical protein
MDLEAGIQPIRSDASKMVKVPPFGGENLVPDR